MKKLIILVTLFLFYCKATPTKQVTIKQLSSSEHVILYYSKKLKTISVISFPISLNFINKTSKDRLFLNYKYLYGNQHSGNPMVMYSLKNNTPIRQSVSAKKNIKPKDSNQYFVRSKHFVDTTKFNDSFFKPYIQKLQTENKDTLHIGTVAEFEKKHKALFETLTKNDSISVQFLDGDKFGERITVPVKW